MMTLNMPVYPAILGALMTGLDGFMAALAGEEPDIVPVWELIINEPTLSAFYGPVDVLEFVDREGLDGVTIFENWQWNKIGDGRWIDEWGIEFRAAEGGVPYPFRGPIATHDDLQSYEPPDPNAPYRLDALKQAVERFEGKRAVVFLTHEAFEWSHYVRGLDNLMIDYIEAPDFVHDLARIVSDYKIDVVGAAIDAGADAVVSGDDYAHRHAPMMSVGHFEEYSLPYLDRLVKAVHLRDIPLIKHTDGNIWSILDQMVDVGIDAIDPLEPIAGMDIGEVKRQYGDRVAVVGNVDCTEVLTHAPIEEVVDAVKETIAKASVGGGHILASSNSIHPAVKPENYKAMVEAARKFGQYPLDEEMVTAYSERSYIAKYLDA